MLGILVQLCALLGLAKTLLGSNIDSFCCLWSLPELSRKPGFRAERVKKSVVLAGLPLARQG